MGEKKQGEGTIKGKFAVKASSINDLNKKDDPEFCRDSEVYSTFNNK